MPVEAAQAWVRQAHVAAPSQAIDASRAAAKSAKDAADAADALNRAAAESANDAADAADALNRGPRPDKGLANAPLLLSPDQFKQLMDASRPDTAVPKVAQKAGKSGYAAWMDRQIETIRQHGYLDLTQFSRHHREERKSKGSGRAPPKVLQMGEWHMSTGEPDELDVADVMDPGMFWQGFDWWVLQCTKYPETKGRVVDLLEWKFKISDFKASSKAKVLYMKEFMYKYQGVDEANDWCLKFSTDFELMTQYLIGSQDQSKGGSRGAEVANKRKRESEHSYRGYTHDHGGGRGRGGGGRSSGSRGGGGRNRSDGGRDGGRGDDRRGSYRSDDRRDNQRAHSQGPAKCFSRSDPAEGECTYSDCRFDHSCVSCGGDHSAASCSRWDATKTRKRARPAPRH